MPPLQRNIVRTCLSALALAVCSAALGVAGAHAGTTAGTGATGSSAATGAEALAGCTVARTRDCRGRTTIRRHHRKFYCDRPLRRFGPLPLKVIVTFTRGRPFLENGAIDLNSGCRGDGDPQSVDLIVQVQGNGRNRGPSIDAFKVRRDVRNIQITGRVNCGRRYGAAHQDGVQLQGGTNLTFVDFRVGRYKRGLSTCQGAGGAFFYSSGGTRNVDVVRGAYIGCNHSLFAGAGTGTVRGAKFRSGRTDGSDSVCVGFAGSPPCERRTQSINFRNITCQRWHPSRNRWVRGR